MSKQYPSQVLKITDVTNEFYINSRTYMYFLQRVTLMCLSMFKWTNLPNNIPERFVERILFSEGKISFLDDRLFGYMMTRCTQYGELNFYDEPVAWKCYSSNGYDKDFSAEDVEIIRNNKMSLPTTSVIDFHLSRLFNLQRTIDANLWQQRHPIVIKSTESQRLTWENLFKKYDDNGYLIYGTDKLNLKDIESLDLKVPFIAPELYDLMEKVWNDLINSLGVNSANTSKKERLISDEANANNQIVQLNKDIMLEEREIAVERINAKFGLNIKVEMRNELNTSLLLENKGSEEE